METLTLPPRVGSRAAPGAAQRLPRRAGPEQLDTVNALVEAAVLAWPLPERLRRRAVPVLRYGARDFDAYVFALLPGLVGPDAAVAVLDPGPIPGPGGGPAARLHGLYVHPQAQGGGAGRCLHRWAVDAAVALGRAGLLVHAERISKGFFEALGYERLPEEDGAYPYRYWYPAQA